VRPSSQNCICISCFSICKTCHAYSVRLELITLIIFIILGEQNNVFVIYFLNIFFRPHTLLSSTLNPKSFGVASFPVGKVAYPLLYKEYLSLQYCFSLVTQATRSIAVIVALLTFKGTVCRTTPATTFSICHFIKYTRTSRGKFSSEYSAAVKYKLSYTNCIIIIIIQTNKFRGKKFNSFVFRIQNIYHFLRFNYITIIIIIIGYTALGGPWPFYF